MPLGVVRRCLTGNAGVYVALIWCKCNTALPLSLSAALLLSVAVAVVLLSLLMRSALLLHLKAY